MAEEMTATGYDGPPIDVVVVEGKMYVVDGHHRLKAAKVARLPSVPIRVVEDLAKHRSSWKTLDEVVRDAAEVGPDNLRHKGKRF